MHIAEVAKVEGAHECKINTDYGNGIIQHCFSVLDLLLSITTKKINIRQGWMLYDGHSEQEGWLTCALFCEFRVVWTNNWPNST